MELNQAIERLKEFDCMDCQFPTCEKCEINYGDVQAIKTALEAIENYQNTIEVIEDLAQKNIGKIVKKALKGEE